jgi:diacylglycerol O-acyltransferase
MQNNDVDRHISVTSGAFAILQGPAPEFAEVRSEIGRRTAHLPWSRSIVRTNALGLERPDPVTEKTFNIDHHVRRIGVSKPGNGAELNRTVADLMERRLDRSHPLWEVWILEGLSADRWAMLVRVHPGIAYRIDAAAMLSELCDASNIVPIGPASPALPARLRAGRPRSGGVAGTDSANGGPHHQPAVPSRDPISAGMSAMRSTFDMAAAAGQVIANRINPNLQVIKADGARRFGTARVSMTDIQLICRRLNVSFSDVALSAITDGVRCEMLRRGMPPVAGSLRTLTPVSVRPDADELTADDRVSLMHPNLPVERSDPIDQLRAVRQRRNRSVPGDQYQTSRSAETASNHASYPLLASVVRMLRRPAQHELINLPIYMHMPRQRLQFMYRDIATVAPVPPITPGLHTAIAILSYRDHLTFGVIGDLDAQIDAAEIAEGIENGVDRLFAIANAAKRSRRVGHLMLLSS